MSLVIEGRRIVKKGGKFYVYSEDYKKKLGGPYDSKEEALKRLGAVEYFKHKEGRIAAPDYEVRSFAVADDERARPKVKDSPDGPVIYGYASVFGKRSQDLGGFRETIHPKAFDAVMGGKPDVRALGNHDPNQLLGRTKSGTLDLSVDEEGLAYEIRPPKSHVADHILRSIERGDTDGSSFSFTVDKGGDSWDRDQDPPLRTVHSVRDLFDVGPVTYPAYTEASAAMRSLRRSLVQSDPGPSQAELLVYRQRLLRLRLPLFPSFATKG
jgi:HK97 family phage prohead protease